MDSLSSFNVLNLTPDTVPISSQYPSSPLKRKRPPNTDKESVVAIAIFKTKAARPLIPLESGPNYLSDLPPTLKIVGEQIEQFLMLHSQSDMYISLIRSLILNISQTETWTEERKLAELGIIYYYLISNKKVSNCHSSMLKMRLLDIENEVLKLKAEHKLLNNKKLETLFPSGRSSYLLRSFVRMIFIGDGHFNLGGCHAVQQLLHTRLAAFFSEEQRLQILHVTKKLIEESNFLKLFQEPFIVHSDLEELILIDMKLPPNEKMEFIYVQWALLMALFAEIGGQYVGEENCYAIAATSKMIADQSEFVLLLLIDALKTGAFYLGTQAFPVLPLLESRRQYEVDFQQELEDIEAENLVAYSVANAVLEPEENPTTIGQVKLSQKIEDHFGEDAVYAKEIFLSLKQNFLQQIVITLFQFHAVNGKSSKNSDITIESSCRETLFNYIKKAIVQSFTQMPILDEIIEKFYFSFFNHFFLVGYHSWKKKRVGDTMVFDFQPQGLLYDPSLDYASFESIQRLLFCKDNSFNHINSLDQFNDKLIEIVEAMRESQKDSEYQNALNDLILFFHTTTWKKKVADLIIYKWNKKGSELKLNADIYLKSNSFFLVQFGGNAEIIGEWALKKPFRDSRKTIHSSPSTEALFLKICHEMKDFNELHPDFFNQPNKILLASNDAHVFTLNPQRFKKYWSDPNRIVNAIVVPAKKMWNKRPSEQAKLSILKMVCNEKTAKTILSKISKGQIGLCRYRKEVMAHLMPETVHKFTEAIENYMQKIDINDFIKKIEPLCAKL